MKVRTDSSPVQRRLTFASESRAQEAQAMEPNGDDLREAAPDGRVSVLPIPAYRAG